MNEEEERLNRIQRNILNKEVTIYIKDPNNFRYKGKVTDLGEKFLIIENRFLNTTNWLAFDNIKSLEIEEDEE